MKRFAVPDYAELWCLSNFSFLRGASFPEELVARAHQLGYQAIALTDECTMSGIVRAHVEAKERGMRLLVGAQFEVSPGAQVDVPFTLVLLATNLNGYGNLCEFITRLRRGAQKGTYQLNQEEVIGEDLADCLALVAPCRGSQPGQQQQLAQWLLTEFIGRCWFVVVMLRQLDDDAWLHRMREVHDISAVPLVAGGDVHMHVRSRKPLQDVMTSTRVGRPLTDCGLDLQLNAERHLRTRLRLAQTYPEDLLAETLRVMDRCDFSMDELRYQYPAEVVPKGETPDSYLRRLTYEGAGRRWPAGMPVKVQAQIEHELALISELRYEHYFLTVADIVNFARSQHILCQGRGSAANSVVCYCLGVTEVDPARMSVLFERFISKERNEPPDIDVDFEHERREEVIQYLYGKYGRSRAALTANLIRYRPKSAIRDVGKALGFSLDAVEVLAKNHHWWDGEAIDDENFKRVGLDPNALQVKQLLHIANQVMGMPRHLSQHPGGFVLTKGPLSRMVPIENASMADRTVVQWDKDDLDALGLLKVDVLALGMLTAIRKALAFISDRKGYVFEVQDIPPEDPGTYDMICEADTIGVFQIESRAQQSMLPRLKPRCFYDLVIEVAIVRPGPIQGNMIHPYLNRRMGKELVVYPSAVLEEALGRTLGVPIFQEQVMQISILAAGFTPGEADALRRSMAAWRRKGGLQKYYDKIVDGMTARGYDKAFAESIFEQIKGFAEYGFPESHAASFALLVYASCWIKHHHPAEFLAALINSQPMGFYPPGELVMDAQAHGVKVLPIDVMYSDWDCTLEGLPHPPDVRLGLRLVDKLKAESGRRIVEARRQRPFESAEDLAIRADLEQHEMTQLAAADALRSLSGHRRQQVWDASALKRLPALWRRVPIEEDYLEIEPAPEGEEIVWDYASVGFSLRHHPLALLRDRLTERGLVTARELKKFPNGRLARTCGIVTRRQQPSTARGTIFVSLQDETGYSQVIVWRSLRDSQRDALLNSRLLEVHGVWQQQETGNLIAGHLVDLTPLLGRLATESRDFH
jgi:error-prone DNA polymerase